MNDTLRLFSEHAREYALKQLVEFSRTQPAIAGTVLVGSGAHGFKDDYSDIDLVFVSDPGAVDTVIAACGGWLKTHFQSLFFTAYQHRDDVSVLCVLRRDMLEADVGIWSTDSLFATQPTWQMIYSRDAQAEVVIKKALENNVPLPRPYEPQVTGDNPMWQFVVGRFIALMRGDDKQAAFYSGMLKEKLVRGDELVKLYGDDRARYLEALLRETDKPGG